MTDQVRRPAPRELLVAANGELNVTQLEAGAVTLVRSGGDGTFDDGNEITVEGLRVSIRSLAPTVVRHQGAHGRVAGRSLSAAHRGPRRLCRDQCLGHAIDAPPPAAARAISSPSSPWGRRHRVAGLWLLLSAMLAPLGAHAETLLRRATGN